jgi:glycosyltransferase involved in cell wall biosynthesis
MRFEVRDILALIQHPDVPGDNWRLIRPCLRMRGDDDQEMPTDPEETVLIVRLLTGTDEATIDRWLSERRPKVRAIVYEFDDVLWSEAMVSHLERADFMQGKSRAELLRQGELARYFASQCDGVIVSSEPLADAMRPFTDRPVIVVPNMLDVRWFRAQMAARPGWADHLTIGWAGGRRPEADLVPMARAWGRIARRYPEVRFVVASSLVPDVIFREVDDLDRIIRLPWVSWNDYPVIYQTDIGCCAVEDTEFSRAKTAIKCWEGAIAGAAMIGTEVLYGPCLAYGGLTANTDADWEDALAYLIERPDTRRAMNAALAQHVERHHSIDRQLHRWPAALAQIVAASVAVLA